MDKVNYDFIKKFSDDEIYSILDLSSYLIMDSLKVILFKFIKYKLKRNYVYVKYQLIYILIILQKD